MEENAFLSALSRLPEVPIRLAKLPFQIVGEALNTPTARAERLAASTQRNLAADVTGEETPFSRGRQVANALSLGLIEGNPSAQVNPSALDEEQRGRFDELNPLQQKLLSTRSPSDFAELINDDSFFEERAPATEAGRLRNDVKQGFLTEEQADFESARGLGQGQELVGADGEAIAENAIPIEGEPSFASKADPKELFAAGFSPDSIQAFAETQDFSVLELDEERLRRSMEADKSKRPTLDTTRNQYNGLVKPFQKLAQSFSGLIGSFGSDPDSLPPDIAAVLNNAGVDASKIAPSAMRDVALIFGFMKILDPESVVRESEQELVRAARGFGFGEVQFNRLFTGQSLTDKQRQDIFKTVSDQFQAKMEGYRIIRESYLDIAAAAGADDPEVQIPDYLSNISKFLNDGAGDDPALDIPTDEEIDAAALDYQEAGGDINDDAALEKYLRTVHGFNL